MIIYFFIAFFLSLIFTWLVKNIALRLHVVDNPDGQRHLHAKPTPLLGGIAIFLSFWAVILFTLIFHPIKGIERIADPLILAFISSAVLMCIGIADDVRPFSAKVRLPLVAVVIGICAVYLPWLSKITNPWGGYIELGRIVGSILVFSWLLGMTYTTKILDGLDGLATGVVSIGAFVIVLLSSITKFYQPNVALVAFVFLAACLGFLIFNFHPAKIFLGESGSMFIGFMLGVLAIIGGGKLATALLVMAIPILDLIRVVYKRFRRGQPIFTGDREHLHFRLVDSGFSQKQAVLFLYGLAFFFGITTLFLQSMQKFYALMVLIVVMAVLGHLIGRKKI
ncbi:MAG: undecaprenyl/decaprenyl-phosphate alpha-N-acetylglucosaminyl 1-phosphate transferase, partial [Candidatus Magasanikbacteria bacterium]|nr:undecaprenyl/decaprenyl-phosphate alpha-N-acetylglucosaminyl 1-phosphate transferase [Candidatus Magasanikbacteria bacterium]